MARVKTVDDMARAVRRFHKDAKITPSTLAGHWLIVTKGGIKIIGRGKTCRDAWANAVERLGAEV